MNAVRLVAAGALIVALGGCALFKAPDVEPSAPGDRGAPAVPVEPEPPQPPPAAIEPARPAPPAVESERLLDYFRHVRRLGSAELGREHESARGAYLRTRSEFDRVRLAMVLSLPDTTLKDESRALEMLEPVVRNPNSPLHGLATLLHAFVQEQRRLEKSVQGMQRKLDALKAMERNLIERKR